MISGYVYKIVALDSSGNNFEECYIGSTTKELEVRFGIHKATYLSHKENKSKLYCSSFKMFDKYGIDKCHIEQLAQIKAVNKDLLNKFEGSIIRSLAKQCVNVNIAGRTSKQYHKEKNYASQKNYFKTDKGREALKLAKRRYSQKPEVFEKRKAKYQELKAKLREADELKAQVSKI